MPISKTGLCRRASPSRGDYYGSTVGAVLRAAPKDGAREDREAFAEGGEAASAARDKGEKSRKRGGLGSSFGVSPTPACPRPISEYMLHYSKTVALVAPPKKHRRPTE